MKQLNARRILLGVTGGIAAYKSAELIRRLKDHGADVRVVMTKAAQEFITPMTLQALSGNPVHTEMLDPAAEAAMGHIELARWADLVLIAPASADFMARLAGGHADDLLTTVCLATAARKAIAPAMNQQMWADVSTQKNLEILGINQVSIFGPASGSQACGDVGLGRMLEPDLIAEATAGLFQSRDLDGVKVTITAGPTREAIDPVRYISNHSSGKMGYALAQAAADLGAVVTLISGPVNLACPDRVNRINVISAQDMYDVSVSQLGNCELFIACAAVADYRPVAMADQKIKKDNSAMTIELCRNHDIVATVAAHKERPFTVGFAAETQDVEQYARGKLERKNLDMIVANDVANQAIGFNSDDNAVSVYWPSGSEVVQQASKTQIAQRLLAIITQQLKHTGRD